MTLSRDSRQPPTGNPFRLLVLGGAALVAPTGTALVQQRRRIALLAAVAAAGDRGLSRDKLLSLLSPESPPDSARHALHNLLYYLRKQLGDALFLGTDPLRVNPAVLGSDLTDYHAALSRRALAEAAALYRGPFLDGFHLGDSSEFEAWLADQRAQLAARQQEVLRTLATTADARGESAEAVRWWRQLVALDPLAGRGTLGLMRSLVAVGDGAEALGVFRRHQVLLGEELGVSPDPTLVAEAARVSEAGPPVAPSPVIPRQEVLDPPRRPAGPRLTRPAPLMLGALLVGVALLGGATWWGAAPGKPAPTIERLAVLPLVNGTGDSTVSLLAEALTQELISSLVAARVPVLGYYSVARYQGTNPPLARVGSELGVDAVATWTVRRGPDGFRVSLEVALVESGEGLWVSTAQVVDSLGLADVAAGTARELVARFGAPVSRASPRLVGDSKAASEAKLAYLQGMQTYYRGEGAFASGLGHFERAIATDSSFAPAFAGLGIALMYAIDYGLLPVGPACDRARPAIARALALGPDLALSHLARARIAQHCDWRWAEAEAAYRQAIALEPSAMAYQMYGWLLGWYLGRFEEAVAMGDTAVALDPGSAMMHLSLGWRLTQAGQLDRAESEVRTAITLDSVGGTSPTFQSAGTFADAHWALAELHLRRGDLAAAEREALAHRDLTPATPAGWNTLGEIYGRTGRAAEARAYLTTLRSRRPGTGADRVAVARTQLALGDRDGALATLEAAVKDRIFIMPYQPYWDPIRPEPRFQALMRALGL